MQFKRIVVLVQCATRCWLACWNASHLCRKRSATIIQCVIKRWIACCKSNILRWEKVAILVQCAVWCWVARQKVVHLRIERDVILVQWAIRCWFARQNTNDKLEENAYVLSSKSVIVIQKKGRSYSARIGFLLTLACLIIVQVSSFLYFSWWQSSCMINVITFVDVYIVFSCERVSFADI